MKLTKITPQILVFKCKTRKEMTMTFCRVQEFYEAQSSKLRGQSFDVFKFLEIMTQDDGEMNYFSSWSGFNFPSNIFHQWRKLNPVATPYEAKLISMIEAALPKGKPFYILGMLADDEGTLDHEIAHAMFFLDPTYRKLATDLVKKLPPKLRRHMTKVLRKLGYAEGVTIDEINAYLATSKKSYMKMRFDLGKSKLAPMAEFKSAFAEYKADL